MPILKRSGALDAEQLMKADGESVPLPDDDSVDSRQELANVVDKALRELEAELMAIEALDVELSVLRSDHEDVKADLQVKFDGEHLQNVAKNLTTDDIDEKSRSGNGSRANSGSDKQKPHDESVPLCEEGDTVIHVPKPVKRSLKLT